MTLGEKIKGRRQELGLTQQDLAGHDITRNMLSQIENDTALPSLPTLKMLSEKLKMPCGYFLSPQEDALSYLKLDTQPKLLELFRQRKYEDCIALANRVYGSLNDDETAYFRCEVYTRAAERAMYSGAMQQALSYANQALALADKTQYEVGHLLCVAILVSAICKNPNAPRLEFEEEKYHTVLAHTMRQDLYHYMTDDLNYHYTDQTMDAHMNAKKLMRQNKFDQAYQQMESIHTKYTTESISAYVLWRLFGDMEICARNRRDFENAYRISTKRMSLLTAFQS